MRYPKVLFFIPLILYSVFAEAQKKNEPLGADEKTDIIIVEGEDGSLDTDAIPSFEKKSKLDPKRASLLSAVLPGLGQVYNGQAWKVPIIYGGAAIFGTWISYNNRLYQTFRNDELTIINLERSKLRTTPDLNFVQRNRESFRRNRDYAVIIAMAFYALNIVDAHVSAHLKEFDINKDLSLKVDPYVELQHQYASSSAYGFKFQLTFD